MCVCLFAQDDDQSGEEDSESEPEEIHVSVLAVRQEIVLHSV